MCELCVEIDKQIERYRELRQAAADPDEIARITRLIEKLYRDRVQFHQGSERH